MAGATFPGFGERLKKDLVDLYTDRILKGDPNRDVGKFANRVNVETPVDRKYSLRRRIGISEHHERCRAFWVTKREYEKLEA